MFLVFDYIGRIVHSKYLAHPDYNWQEYHGRPKSKQFQITCRQVYLTMTDGVKIACNIYLPTSIYNKKKKKNSKQPTLGKKVTTIIHATRYCRAWKVRFPHNLTVDDNFIVEDQNRQMMEALVRNGYCFFCYDVRGTGSSTGSRIFDLSHDDKKDMGQIVRWILKQSWCDGVLGTWGISFSGALSQLFYGLKIPNIRSSISCFAPFSFYRDVIYPGGCFLNGLWHLYSIFCRDCETYNLGDSNVWEFLASGKDNMSSTRAAAFVSFAFKYIMNGPMPVNNNYKMLEVARNDHMRSQQCQEELKRKKYADDRLECLDNKSYDEWEYNILGDSLISKKRRRRHGMMLTPRIRSYSQQQKKNEGNDNSEDDDVPIYLIGSWYDTFAVSTIQCYLTMVSLGQKNVRLTIGSWCHGGIYNCSSHSKTQRTTFSFEDEVVRYFDYTLRGKKSTKLENEEPVHYFVIGLEEWVSSQSFPPPTRPVEIGLGRDCQGKYGANPGMMDEHTDYNILDFSFTSTVASRFNVLSMFTRNLDMYQFKSRFRDRLQYQTSPFKKSYIVTGRIEVKLKLAVDKFDGVVFVYLFETNKNDDREWKYITQGHLHLEHRNGFYNNNNSHQKYSLMKGLCPIRTFSRKDVQKMKPLVPENIQIFMYPVSYLLRKGACLKIAITGSDKYNFDDSCVDEKEKSKIFVIYKNESFVHLPCEVVVKREVGSGEVSNNSNNNRSTEKKDEKNKKKKKYNCNNNKKLKFKDLDGK